MVYSNRWSVFGAKRYGGSDVVPSSRCDWVAHLSDSFSKRTTPSKKRKLLFESQEQIICIDYGIVRTLARNEPKTCPQRQDTAKILVCLNHFSASVHFISTESPEYIVKLAYIPLSISVIYCGVSYAHLLPYLPFPVAFHAHHAHLVHIKRNWTLQSNNMYFDKYVTLQNVASWVVSIHAASNLISKRTWCAWVAIGHGIYRTY